MKLSEAILKGYMTNGGRQCVGRLVDDKGALCVMGARNVGITGNPCDFGFPFMDDVIAFAREWGTPIVTLNNNEADGEPFPREHIYGMAVAAGL